MLFNIQVLRGIAAALVVWVHAQEIITDTHIPHAFRHVGFAGVDLFFVISGFIMVHSTSKREMTPGYFFSRRLLRVAPLYYSFTLLVCLICAISPSIFKSTSIDFASVYKSLLFIPFEKSADRIYPVYFLGWTLNYEMFFYALFSVALFVKPAVRTLVIGTVLLTLASVGLFISTPDQFGVMAYFYTRPIILDFVLGMLIADYAHLRPAVSARSARIYWLIFVAGCFGLILLDFVLPAGPADIAPSTGTFFRFGVPAALIVWGAVGLDRAKLKFGTEWMRKLGDASYSIYLSHYLAVGLFAAIIARTLHGEVILTIAAAATLGAAIGFGVVTYQLVERPLSGDFRHLLAVIRQSARERS